MASIEFDPATVMGSRNMSLSRSPFAPGRLIIKRASFPKGEIPKHLMGYLIKKGECAGLTGKGIGPRGQPVPKTALCVMEKHVKVVRRRRASE